MEDLDDRRRDVALFRYSQIREAADTELSPAERGVLVRHLAAREHVMPDGSRVRVGRSTIDRWIRNYRAGGYHALVPEARRGVPLTGEHILDAAVTLKREEPRRSAAHIAAVLAERGWSVSARPLQRHFARLGLNHQPEARVVFGRFEAEARNDRWIGDAMHGRFRIGQRKPILFAFVDDHSRLIPGAKWGYSEDTIRLEVALRDGLLRAGSPRSSTSTTAAPSSHDNSSGPARCWESAWSIPGPAAPKAAARSNASSGPCTITSSSKRPWLTSMTSPS